MSQSIVNQMVGLPPGTGPFDPTPDYDLGPGHGLIPNAFNEGGEFGQPSVNSAGFVGAAALPALPVLVGAAEGTTIVNQGLLVAGGALHVAGRAAPVALILGAERAAEVAFGFSETFDSTNGPSASSLPRAGTRFQQLGRGLGHVANNAGPASAFLQRLFQ